MILRESTQEEKVIKKKKLERYFNGDDEPSEELIVCNLTKEQSDLKQKVKICKKNKFNCNPSESSEKCAHYNKNISYQTKFMQNLTK